MPRWLTGALARLALVLFGLALALGLLLLVEGVLALVGAGKGAPGYDPLAGFSPTVALFGPTARPDGTPIFRASPARLRARPTAPAELGPQREFLAEKPPGLFRIFVIGDSTAAGIPYQPAYGFSGWLRRRLIGALGTERVEVVNAAVSGYGSRRVLVTLREIATHQPDVVVIYSGHNEMAERQFYSRLYGMNPRLFWLLERAVSTRIFTLLSRRLFMPRAPTPEEVARFAREDSLYATEMFGVTTEHSAGRRHWTAADFARRDALYRANIEEMVRVTRAAGARPVLLTLTQNFSDWPPGSSLHRPDLGADEERRWQSRFAAGERAAAAGDCAGALASGCRRGDRRRVAEPTGARPGVCVRSAGRRGRVGTGGERSRPGAARRPTSCNDTIRDIAARRGVAGSTSMVITEASGGGSWATTCSSTSSTRISAATS
jgi:hypothetical protein